MSDTVQLEQAKDEMTELHKQIVEMEQDEVSRMHQPLAYLSEMIVSLTHEVNNPLGAILLYSELLIRNDVSHPLKKDLKVIHNEAKRAAQAMTELTDFYSATVPDVRRTHFHNLVKKIFEIRRYTRSVRNIRVSTNLGRTAAYVKCDPAQLKHAIMQVVMNAEETLYKQGGGNIVVATRQYRGRVRLSIAHNGPGIPEKQLERVFQPFLTMKSMGEKATLESSSCQAIITAYGGTITAQNNRMGGVTFTIELPVD